MRRRGGRALAVLLLAGVGAFGVVVLAPLALASGGKLEFVQPAEEEKAFSTRVHLVIRLLTGGLPVKWRAAYATGAEGPWTQAGSGTGDGANEISASLGGGASVPFTILHHLEPATAYYAKFEAENAAKETAEVKVPFTTTAAARPEVSEWERDALPGGFHVTAASPTSAVVKAEIDCDGAPTEYTVEYAPAEEGHAPAPASALWVAFAAGAVTVEQDYEDVESKLSGLTPETTYYTRMKASNAYGAVIDTEGKTQIGAPGDGSFKTPPAKPGVSKPNVFNVTADSARLADNFLPRGLETQWHFEYMLAGSAWIDVPGGSGVVTQQQAEALPEGVGAVVTASLTGLAPASAYYVRFFAENAEGEGVVCVSEVCEPVLTEARGIDLTRFDTFGPPLVLTLAAHGIHGAAMRGMGGVNPDSLPTFAEQTVSLEATPTGGTFTLTFKGKTTGAIPYHATGDDVGKALRALEVEETGGSALEKPEVSVNGAEGGPYTVSFYGRDGGLQEPALTGDGSTLVPAGPVGVSVLQAGGEAYDTHYHFEYVSRAQFEEDKGWSKAVSTAPVDLGYGDTVKYVGADLPGLGEGETYYFRAVATNTSPGDPVVDGEPQVLHVPVVPTSGGPVGTCPNESVRGGLSAGLTDCRAFELVTPAEKGGAQEIFNYGGASGQEGSFPAADGEHMEYTSSAVKWGNEAGDGQAPYFFSRKKEGWKIVAGSVQPEAGVDHYIPQLFAANLEGFAFKAVWVSSPSYASHDAEFKAGPAGGPYATAASVPTGEAEPGWKASSDDFRKLILEVSDHKLAGHPSGTLSGHDLYEYLEGKLGLVNVKGAPPGVRIGSCGARIANGFRLGAGAGAAVAHNHAVSEDGSVVFFEETPGSVCSQPTHVYARIDGGREDAHTLDLGAFRLIAADPSGGRALVEKALGENAGLYVYDVKAEKAEFLPGSEVAVGFLPESQLAVAAEYTVSDDLSTVYIRRQATTGTVQGNVDIYRYDISAKSIMLVTHIEADSRQFYGTNPDGRYFYFMAAFVGGLPTGGLELQTPGAGFKGQTTQVFRFDSREMAIECLSCSSPSDAEPVLSALFTTGAEQSPASVNGDYVFFDSAAALVEGDVDGQIAPEGLKGNNGGLHTSSYYSLSSDVYEWRAPGVGGCGRLSGCVSLVTSGGGGFLNILLGASSSGSDVFFATSESLVGADRDTASDIYDARVGGGFGEPVEPAPCEGDACSSPFAPPGEVTPASATFEGSGNFKPSTHKAKPKKKTVKRKCKARRGHRCTRAKRQARRGARKSNGVGSVDGGVRR